MRVLGIVKHNVDVSDLVLTRFDKIYQLASARVQRRVHSYQKPLRVNALLLELGLELFSLLGSTVGWFFAQNY